MTNSINIQTQFGTHFGAYEKIRIATNLSSTTLENERKNHHLFWKYLIDRNFQGDELDITLKEFKAYSEYVCSNNHLKINTKWTRLSNLRPFYREAAKHHWIVNDFTLQLPLPKVERPIIPVLSVKQMKELLSLPNLDSVVDFRNAVMMELLYSTAMRSKSLLSLTASSFLEDFSLVKIIGKGDKEAVLPVGKMARHLIKFYIEYIWEHLNKQNLEELFLDLNTGAKLKRDSFNVILRDYANQLGFKQRLSFHTFRYSACSHLANEGVDIRLLQEYMTHEHIDTTARYIQQNFERLKSIHSQTHPSAKA